MFPFEFTVAGIPLSQQTRNRARLEQWRQTVRREAAIGWSGAEPTESRVKITVVYYYEGVALDVDNMLKPVQDALNGLVYVDDAQVSDVLGAKRDINGSFRVRGLSPVLAEAFGAGAEFLYVRIETDLDHEVLP